MDASCKKIVKLFYYRETIMERWRYEDNRERVREYIRGLLWLLNEESGGIGSSGAINKIH